MMWKLLYIEDDEDCAYTIVGGLELLKCYEIAHSLNGEEGWEAYQAFQPDVVVSDVEMPKLNGFELTQRIRKNDKDTLILLATGRQLPKDVIRGFELGIDNYIKKPFVAQELHAHIQALLAKKQYANKQTQNSSQDTIVLGKYLLDTQKENLWLQGKEIKLTAKEFGILKLLLDNRGKIIRREDILLHFWGNDSSFTSRSLDVFVSKLRKYLSSDESLRITNIRGKGLLFEE